MSEYYQQIVCVSSPKYSVVIEDDGRVCYAYLLLERSIVSDVWLYNQDETPSRPPWASTGILPFLNPKEFAVDDPHFGPIRNEDDIKIECTSSDLETLMEARILINGRLAAVLKPGCKPGWSVNAKKD
ncbi:hypothetical protein Q4E93_31765 [Flavitalea sp. BT771]|uniref:hypothetical protein n=1 Tax=Flavitalea sp. BT771 TaxID=3063329 RepID=UPI0026E19DE8|nr:hypothetical protein [Flavitalea sp. BT771]MDO6435237.1 hypothetical protein [Flavitalea sp. BT771]MDV6224058.1 hypothetical protein [Flavitalea sp. BT771]